MLLGLSPGWHSLRCLSGLGHLSQDGVLSAVLCSVENSLLCVRQEWLLHYRESLLVDAQPS